jgi:putative oxidoreductase
MNLISQIKQWYFSHPIGFTILRVALGVCLAIQGIYFLNNAQALQKIIEDSIFNKLNIHDTLAIVVTWAHILGGTLIILGLITRIAAWIQIPITLGAIIFVNKNNIFTSHLDLLLSVFILISLIFFAFEGGGFISMDEYVKKELL